MSTVILGMAMSLDGYVEDASGSVARLYPDLAALGETESLQESIRATGAVVMGRRAFAMGDPDAFAGSYEYQVPIFVLTHRPPARQPRQTEQLTFTFVTDGIESAIRQAKAAAGEKAVTVIGGASTFQQCLNAGLADELQLLIVPVLLGAGLRLFDSLRSAPPELELARVARVLGGVELTFRVAP